MVVYKESRDLVQQKRARNILADLGADISKIRRSLRISTPESSCVVCKLPVNDTTVNVFTCDRSCCHSLMHFDCSLSLPKVTSGTSHLICIFCGKKTTCTNRVPHISMMDKTATAKCTIPGCTFEAPVPQTTAHVFNQHNGAIIFRCYQCEEVIEETKRVAHIKECQGQVVVPCDACGDQFPNNAKSHEHRRQHLEIPKTVNKLILLIEEDLTGAKSLKPQLVVEALSTLLKLKNSPQLQVDVTTTLATLQALETDLQKSMSAAPATKKQKI